MIKLNRDLTEEYLEKSLESNNWFTFKEFYEQVAANPDYETFVEVGVWKGHSISFLVQELQKRGKEFTVYAVDLWNKLPEEDPLRQAFPEEVKDIYDIYFYQLHKTNTRKDIFDIVKDSAEAASMFKDESVDFCFIDAAHDEKSVRKDVEAWFPKVAFGGILAGHDMSHPQVFKAVCDFLNEQALKDFKLHVNHEEDCWMIQKTKK